MGGSDRTRALSPKAMSAEKLLFELQVEQHRHDETYHREIARLPMHQRLNHMALHFAKYTGKVAAAEDRDALVAVYLDILIIGLSTANVLNIELWDIIEPIGREFLGLSAFGRLQANDMTDDLKDKAALLRVTAVAAGRMAAACEKIDHLEEIPFRAEIKSAIASLCCIAFAIVSGAGFDPAEAIRARLSGVKQRLKLHGRI
jgi:hypothetical protein